jgi:hypothetical protein
LTTICVPFRGGWRGHNGVLAIPPGIPPPLAVAAAAEAASAVACRKALPLLGLAVRRGLDCGPRPRSRWPGGRHRGRGGAAAAAARRRA